MRKKIVAGNWKMNKTYDEGLALVSEITNMVQDEVNNEAIVVVCPPFPFLAGIGKALAGNDKVKLGAQNCHQNESGAYTGEVSAAMLKSVGVEYVILGHSERRQYFLEDNQLLEAKVKAALKQGLKPIFCVKMANEGKVNCVKSLTGRKTNKAFYHCCLIAVLSLKYLQASYKLELSFSDKVLNCWSIFAQKLFYIFGC